MLSPCFTRAASVSPPTSQRRRAQSSTSIAHGSFGCFRSRSAGTRSTSGADCYSAPHRTHFFIFLPLQHGIQFSHLQNKNAHILVDAGNCAPCSCSSLDSPSTRTRVAASSLRRRCAPTAAAAARRHRCGKAAAIRIMKMTRMKVVAAARVTKVQAARVRARARARVAVTSLAELPADMRMIATPTHPWTARTPTDSRACEHTLLNITNSSNTNNTNNTSSRNNISISRHSIATHRFRFHCATMSARTAAVLRSPPSLRHTPTTLRGNSSRPPPQIRRLFPRRPRLPRPRIPIPTHFTRPRIRAAGLVARFISSTPNHRHYMPLVSRRRSVARPWRRFIRQCPLPPRPPPQIPTLFASLHIRPRMHTPTRSSWARTRRRAQL